MTNPVALAFGNGVLYVADLTSDFSPAATGAVLAVDANGAITVVSAGTIDAPTGVVVLKDGSLAVAGSSPDTGAGGGLRHHAGRRDEHPRPGRRAHPAHGDRRRRERDAVRLGQGPGRPARAAPLGERGERHRRPRLDDHGLLRHRERCRVAQRPDLRRGASWKRRPDLRRLGQHGADRLRGRPAVPAGRPNGRFVGSLRRGRRGERRRFRSSSSTESRRTNPRAERPRKSIGKGEKL